MVSSFPHPFIPKSIRVLAYDMDGCVFSSESILHQAYIEAIRSFPNPRQVPITIPTVERILLEVGKPVKTIFKNLLPELTQEEQDSISQTVLDELCNSIRKGGGHFYEGIGKAIREAKEMGYQLVGASNGRLPYIQTILETIGVLDLFLPIVTLDNQARKTKGDILLHYQKEYGWKPDSILMIGDRLSDYDAAVQAGTPFAFCSYGHAEPGEIPNQSIVFQKPLDCPNFFKENTKPSR